ncbi:hypothetical protein [Salinibacterium sp. GXW1014]|uniref:hypothetical protein n=1 Tax=Salinibacterium sp. GXW1014 TaxID=3377838 RepID=UPI00383AF377
MLDPLLSTHLAPFILTSSLATPGERTALQQRVSRGDLVTVMRGVHLPREHWVELDGAGRHRALVTACSLVAGGSLVFSHHSAAALWQLPWVGEWPSRAHVTDPPGRRVRSGNFLMRHNPTRPLAHVRIDGLAVTDLSRTVIDLAAVLPFAAAVVVADAALRRHRHPKHPLPEHHATRTSLLGEVARLPPSQGSVKALRVAEFADGRAQLPGESLSRVNMHAAALPAPILQQRLRGASGRAYFVDFWWPTANLIGEFDGDAKYTDPEYLQGRTPAQVLRDEKAREDDLRAAGYRFSRWRWNTAVSPARLRRHLVRAGLRAQ